MGKTKITDAQVIAAVDGVLEGVPLRTLASRIGISKNYLEDVSAAIDGRKPRYGKGFAKRCAEYYATKKPKHTVTTIVKPHGRRLYEVAVPQTGELAFYRDYKEPLRPLENGYGYEGVLLYNIRMDAVQCAICGDWFKSLSLHTKAKHKTSGAEYRERFGLSKSTALVGENMRRTMIGNGKQLASRYSQAAKRARMKQLHKSRKGKRVNNGAPRSMEWKNKRGYCPDQLLAWMRANKDANKDTTDPATVAWVYKTFGSWNRARELAGLPIRKNMNIDTEEALEALRIFVREHGRVPVASDGRRGLLRFSPSFYYDRFGTWSQALIQAGFTPRAKHSGGQVYSQADYKHWKQRYESGETLKSIGKACGTNPTTVRNALRKMGVAMRKPTDYPHYRFR